MTDQPEATLREPSTAAGQDLLRDLTDLDTTGAAPTAMYLGPFGVRRAILAIEAEARASERQRVEALEEALRAIVEHAEADDNFEGEFLDYLVPFEYVAAARALLASPTPEPRPAPLPLDVALLRIFDITADRPDVREIARAALTATEQETGDDTRWDWTHEANLP